jgi:hypothetical protein
VNVAGACATSCNITLTLAGTVGDTTLAVYRPLTSSPVICGTGTGSTQPSVTFTASATSTYYVIVGSTSTTGPITLNYSTGPCN